MSPAPPGAVRPAGPLPARAGAWARWQHRLEATLLGPVLVAGTAASGLLLLRVVDPNEAGHYPGCPFLLVTGLWCPGCGSLRMLHDLAGGDLVGAWGMNPLALLLLPVLLVHWGRWVRRVVTGRPRGAPLAGGWAWAFLALVVAYWVLRNLPGLTVLAPG